MVAFQSFTKAYLGVATILMRTARTVTARPRHARGGTAPEVAVAEAVDQVLIEIGR